MSSLNPSGLTDEQVLNAVRALTKPGEDAHEVRRRRYDTSYDTWRAVPPRIGNVEKWRSRLRVPYAMQTTDTALVNVVSGTPRCLVRPRHPEDADGALAMQQLFDYMVGEDHLAEKQPVFAQQGLIFGVTAAKNHWLYQEANRNTRVFETDSYGRNVPRVGERKVVVRDGPCFEPWNIYDLWWDPNARDVDSAAYVVLRSWLTRDELERNRYDADTGIGQFDNLDKLFSGADSPRRVDSAQETFLGGAQNKRRGAYEILEVWRDDTCVVIGDRRVVLRKMANPYWHGRKPVVIAQTRPDLFEMQGVPEVELMTDLQQAMWTLQNMTLDALHLTIMRGATYRVGSIVDPDLLNIRPNFRWAVQDHDDVRAFEFPQVSSDVYRERERLLADMQLVTGINPYVSGSDMQGVDQNTATGVTALQGAASALLRFKAAQIHFKGFQRTFEQWGDMVQQFLTEPVWVQVAGPEGDKAWREIRPDQVAGHFHYRLEGSEENLTRQQERSEALGLLNAFAPFVQLGVVNLEPLLERVAAAFNISDPKSLLRPQQPALPPPAPGYPNGGGGQQQMAGPPQQQLLNGAAMPSQVSQAITAGR